MKIDSRLYNRYLPGSTVASLGPLVLRTNRSNTSEALSERMMVPRGQRARLNPAPYSASAEPGPSLVTAATTCARRVSVKKRKKRNGSVSEATTYSGHSRTSGVTTVQAGPRAEQSRPRAATPVMGTVRGGLGGWWQ